MHFCAKAIVLRSYQRIVHPCTAQVVRVKGEEVVEGVPPSRVGLLVGDSRRCLRLAVVNGSSGSGETESDGGGFHINGDVPSLYVPSSFCDAEGEVPGWYVLPEVG